MQASETKLRQLLEGTKQYLVPLFQRPYSWSDKQWKALWTDVREQADTENRHPHFFGSIVTAQVRTVPEGVAKHLLIDGQQRMTTSLLLLAAVRDRARRLKEDRFAEKIEQYLVNRFEEGEERFRLLPTQTDRSGFKAVMDGGVGGEGGRIADCHRFFAERIRDHDKARLERLEKAVVDGLSMVSILCDEGDNPHLIFESLNAKGEKLTPADLIRNYVLMKIDSKKQEAIFRTHWLPIQEALGEHLTSFVRHYLMKEGAILRDEDVYFELKDRLKNARPEESEAFLADLRAHGLIYAKFTDPSREEDGEIAERLERLRRLKVTTAYPMLLRVFRAREEEGLDRGQLIETLDVLESFVLRRSICGYPSNQLRKMLPPIFDAIGGAGPDFAEQLRGRLGGRYCPDDEAFARVFAGAELYATADKNQRLWLILSRLERARNDREPVSPDSATIEHVMPQTLTPAWKAELGERAEDVHSELLHTIGNLTLSAYNPELSNKPFAEKRREFARSNFALNRDIAATERWDEDAIRARGEGLAREALAVWPDVSRNREARSRRTYSFNRPGAVRFRDRRIPVRNWKEGFEKLVREIDAAYPGALAEIVDKNYLRRFLSKQNRYSKRSFFTGEVYVNTDATIKNIINWIASLAEAAGIPESDYEFLGGERGD